MLGLGLGSLLGGRISQIERLPALPIFGGIELCIGAYGLVSLRVFHMAGVRTAGAPLVAVALLSFLLVLVPTVLMGGTLPFLVAHLVRVSKNVGRSVSMLYFVNTLGSAFACLICARFLMRMMGESGSVAVAAALNGAVGSIAILAWIAGFREHLPDQDREDSETEPSPDSRAGLLPFPLALALVGLCGFISLSYEILWYRTYSFATGTRASAFALLLAAYLEGIACGSLLSNAICSRGVSRTRTLRMIGWLAIGASLFGFLVIPLMAHLVQHVDYTLTLPLVALSAGLLGAIFPLATHAAVPSDRRAGSGTSYLYLCNIIGSAAGTMLVGFVLADFWSTRQISVFLLLLGLAFGGAVYAGTLGGVFRRLAGFGAVAALAAIGVASAPALFDTIYERMLFKHDYQPGYRFAHLLESRSGVIAVGPDATVFGGGVYDGRFHTSLVNDTNMLVRAYAISAFQASPKNVLMIGLSSGSWAQVILNNPAVARLTVVEINPDYLRLIPQYPQVASILNNSRVTIEIDDGRRWLFRHPDLRFDLVVMNTTFNWRAHATNLLSDEFLQLVRQHLRPAGVLYYNTTDSGDVFLTGTTRFRYGLRVLNFLAVSDRPLAIDKETWRRTLVSYRIDGKPVFDLTRQADQKRLDEVLAMADSPVVSPAADSAAMEFAATIRERYRQMRIITDDNMGTEWY
jgi:spermidine synthase